MTYLHISFKQINTVLVLDDQTPLRLVNPLVWIYGVSLKMEMFTWHISMTKHSKQI